MEFHSRCLNITHLGKSPLTFKLSRVAISSSCFLTTLKWLVLTPQEEFEVRVGAKMWGDRTKKTTCNRLCCYEFKTSDKKFCQKVKNDKFLAKTTPKLSIPSLNLRGVSTTRHDMSVADLTQRPYTSYGLNGTIQRHHPWYFARFLGEKTLRKSNDLAFLASNKLTICDIIINYLTMNSSKNRVYACIVKWCFSAFRASNRAGEPNIRRVEPPLPHGTLWMAAPRYPCERCGRNQRLQGKPRIS